MEYITGNSILFGVILFMTLVSIAAIVFLARERGRSWYVWLVLSLLFTPLLALIVLLYLPSLGRLQNSQKGTSASSKSVGASAGEPAYKREKSPELEQAERDYDEAKKKREQASRDQDVAEEEKKRLRELIARTRAERDVMQTEIEKKEKLTSELEHLKAQQEEELKRNREKAAGLQETADRYKGIKELLEDMKTKNQIQEEKNRETQQNLEAQKQDIKKSKEEHDREALERLKEPQLKGTPIAVTLRDLRWH